MPVVRQGSFSAQPVDVVGLDFTTDTCPTVSRAPASLEADFVGSFEVFLVGVCQQYRLASVGGDAVATALCPTPAGDVGSAYVLYEFPCVHFSNQRSSVSGG